ncbi:MAG: YgaC family protein [Chloroflexi bacterium]|nr:YgaC family protein [Chloroflexota bacterium]
MGTHNDRFLFWKINLQAPLRRTPLGFDSWDHLLDLWVMPDGSWSWKDEDELEEAVDLGLFSEAEARAIRAEGERVIGRLDGLIPTGWERWRPDQAGRRCHCRSAGTAEDPTLPPRPSDASCFRATRNAVLAALAWRLGHHADWPRGIPFTRAATGRARAATSREPLRHRGGKR